MTDTVYIFGDVDAIKEYIFETSYLPQIRGGSQLLIDCEDEILHRYPITTSVHEVLGGRTIYCGGGNFVLEVPATQALDVKREIEQIFLQKTLVATVTVVAEKDLPHPFASAVSDGWAGRLMRVADSLPLDGAFGHRLALLNARSRAIKSQKDHTPFYEAFPFAGHCDCCGKRMASIVIPRGDPEEDEQVDRLRVCPVCARKHERGRLGRELTRGKINEDFQEHLTSQLPCRARQARDLDHLAESARRNYVAFVYADGNEIGDLLNHARTPAQYQQLSAALREGTRAALFRSLVVNCKPALEQDEYWPLEIVNVGGDDVTLIIQAGYAWDVAVGFLETFEDEMARRFRQAEVTWPAGWPSKLTAACGMVVADTKYPVRFLERLATDSLKRAKTVAKRDPGSPRSALDFLWLTTPVMSEQLDPLLAEYQRDNLFLTARPYTLEQAKKMQDLVTQASRWPRSQRYQWAEALNKGLWVSQNTIYYNVARRNERERGDMIAFLNDVSAVILPPELVTLAPIWRTEREKNDITHSTALLDVLELAELRAMRCDQSLVQE